MSNEGKNMNVRRAQRNTNLASRDSPRRVILTTVEAKRQRNRNAQAAFRERRTEYVKELETEMKMLRSEVQQLRAARSSGADEALMLRYENSLLMRLLLEHGVDVHAEIDNVRKDVPLALNPQRRSQHSRSSPRRKTKRSHASDSRSPLSSGSSSESPTSVDSRTQDFEVIPTFSEFDRSTFSSVSQLDKIDWTIGQSRVKSPSNQASTLGIPYSGDAKQLSSLGDLSARPEDDYNCLMATGYFPTSTDLCNSMGSYNETMVSNLPDSDLYATDSFLKSGHLSEALPFFPERISSCKFVDSSWN